MIFKYHKLYIGKANCVGLLLACRSSQFRFVLVELLTQVKFSGFGANDGYVHVFKLEHSHRLRVWFRMLTRLQISSMRDSRIKTLNLLQH